jgi:hypothetical protein
MGVSSPRFSKAPRTAMASGVNAPGSAVAIAVFNWLIAISCSTLLMRRVFLILLCGKHFRFQS